MLKSKPEESRKYGERGKSEGKGEAMGHLYVLKRGERTVYGDKKYKENGRYQTQKRVKFVR